MKPRRLARLFRYPSRAAKDIHTDVQDEFAFHLEMRTDALEKDEIFAAGLDVFEQEPTVNPRLLNLENAVVIPHLGSATVDTRNAMGNLAVDNVFAAIDGTRPPTLLNPDAFTG